MFPLGMVSSFWGGDRGDVVEEYYVFSKRGGQLRAVGGRSWVVSSFLVIPTRADAERRAELVERRWKTIVPPSATYKRTWKGTSRSHTTFHHGILSSPRLALRLFKQPPFFFTPPGKRKLSRN